MPLYLPCRERPERFELNPRAPLANGLVFAGLGALPGTTHFHDSSLHGNDGELTNMTPSDDWVWIDELGRRGVVTDYETDSSYVVSDIGFQPYPFSLAGWVQPSALGNYYAALSYHHTSSAINFFGVARNITGKWSINSRHDASVYRTDSSIDVTIGRFDHVAIVCRSTTDRRIYVNGAYEATQTDNVTDYTGETASGHQFLIGLHRTNTPGFGMPGLYADPLFYSRALSPSEIAQLADPSNAMLSGLLLPPRRVWWPVSGGATPESAWGSIFSTPIISAS